MQEFIQTSYQMVVKVLSIPLHSQKPFLGPKGFLSLDKGLKGKWTKERRNDLSDDWNKRILLKFLYAVLLKNENCNTHWCSACYSTACSYSCIKLVQTPVTLIWTIQQVKRTCTHSWRKIAQKGSLKSEITYLGTQVNEPRSSRSLGECFGRVWLEAWSVEIPIFKALAIGYYQK